MPPRLVAFFDQSVYRLSILPRIHSKRPDDAREFYRRWYTPKNAVVVVVGDVEPSAVRRLAESAYGSIPAHAVPARKPHLEPRQLGQRRLEVKAPAEQAYLMMSWKVAGFAGFMQPWRRSANAAASHRGARG